MDTIEHFSDYLRSIGAHNYLVIGIVIVLLWLLISGIKKGLSRKRSDEDSDDDRDV